MQWIFKWNPNI